MSTDRIVVIGFGNDFRRDDGVGLAALRELRNLDRHREGVDLIEGGIRGTDLIDLLARYERAVVLDAMVGGTGSVGEIIEAPLEKARFLLRPLVSLHNLDLATAFELARSLAIDLPPVDLVLMRVRDVRPGEGLTAEAAKALRRMVRAADERIAALMGRAIVRN